MLTDAALKELEERYTPEPGVLPGVQTGRHRNAAAEALKPVYRHRIGVDHGFPEIGVVEVLKAEKALASAYAELDEYKAAAGEVLTLVKEVRRLRNAMRQAMSDMPSDQSRGYETLSLALGEP